MTYPKVLTQHADTGSKHGHLSRYSRYSGSASIAEPLDYQAGRGDKISQRSAVETHTLHWKQRLRSSGDCDDTGPQPTPSTRALLGQLTAVQLVKNCSAVTELEGLLPRPQ